jgi:tetratricopeptide (TPR) repeat protein
MELGLQEFENFHDFPEALRCLNRAVELDPKRYDAWTFIAMIHAETGNCAAALAALDHAGNGRSGEALREQLRGDMLHDLGKLAQARAAYRRALKADPKSPFVESKLGYVEARIGMKQVGFGKMRHAISLAEDLPELQERLLKACLAVEDLPQAAEIAERLATSFPTPKTILRAASIYAHSKNLAKAVTLIEDGLQQFTGAPELESALKQLRPAANTLNSLT